MCGRPGRSVAAAQGVSKKEIEVKRSSFTIIAVLTIVSPTALPAQTPPTIKVEATKTIGAGSLNPPNPGEACKEAKKNAIDKAASAGFKGTVVWDKLAGSDDCKLSTSQVGHVGYYYTFTAKGTFSLTGVQASLNPQKTSSKKDANHLTARGSKTPTVHTNAIREAARQINVSRTRRPTSASIKSCEWRCGTPVVRCLGVRGADRGLGPAFGATSSITSLAGGKAASAAPRAA
jgi:hypothetical protein